MRQWILALCLAFGACAGDPPAETVGPPPGAVQLCDENPDHAWCQGDRDD